MNWNKGILRIWISGAIIWLIIGIFVNFENIKPSVITGGTYQYDEPLKKLPWETDWNAPYYETHFAPGDSAATIAFSALQPGFIASFENAADKRQIVGVDMPDGSKLYMNNYLNEGDKILLSREFWNRRWTRYISNFAASLLFLAAPPLLFLMVWMIVLWIIRGFKSTTM